MQPLNIKRRRRVSSERRVITARASHRTMAAIIDKLDKSLDDIIEGSQEKMKKKPKASGPGVFSRLGKSKGGRGAGGRQSGGNSVPPDGYVCNICGLAGHWIQQCPSKDWGGDGGRGAGGGRGRGQGASRGAKGGSVPDDYVCKICGIPGHWIQQCRSSSLE